MKRCPGDVTCENLGGQPLCYTAVRGLEGDLFWYTEP